MVSACCNSNQMVLWQLKVNDKSNEIIAIPALLETLMLQGCVVTRCDGLPDKNSLQNRTVGGGAWKLPMKRERTKADRDLTYLLSLFDFKTNF